MLRAIATLDARTDCQGDTDSYAHVRYSDEPVGRGNQPSPSLTEALSELTGTSGSLYGYVDSTMTRPAALGDDLFVVPVFARTYRSTNLGQEFSFALVDDRGVLQGRLGGLHLREDSPSTGFDFTASPTRTEPVPSISTATACTHGAPTGCCAPGCPLRRGPSSPSSARPP